VSTTSNPNDEKRFSVFSGKVNGGRDLYSVKRGGAMVGSSKSPQQSRNPIPLKDVINHSYNRSKTSNHTRGNSNNGLKTEERKNNLKFNSPAKSTYERLNGDKKTTPGGGISHPKNVTEYTEPLPSGSKQNGSSELDSHNKSVIDYSKNRLEVRHDINF